MEISMLDLLMTSVEWPLSDCYIIQEPSGDERGFLPEDDPGWGTASWLASGRVLALDAPSRSCQLTHFDFVRLVQL